MGSLKLIGFLFIKKKKLKRRILLEITLLMSQIKLCIEYYSGTTQILL